MVPLDVAARASFWPWVSSRPASTVTVYFTSGRVAPWMTIVLPEAATSTSPDTSGVMCTVAGSTAPVSIGLLNAIISGEAASQLPRSAQIPIVMVIAA
jgi:hypothetical protein